MPRILLPRFFACLCLVVIVGFDCPQKMLGQDKQPNVLFLAVDDMKDWVNCLGGYQGVVHTPHIDKLASQGMLFMNAHCASPKCAPSRASLLTGLRCSTTGLYDNNHWWFPNLPDTVSLPKHFRDNGYQVVGAGKIFHHTAGNHPPNQWDRFQRIEFREDPWFRGSRLNYPWSRHEPFPRGFPFSKIKGLGHENDWGSLDISDEKYDDENSIRFAIEFLRAYSSGRQNGVSRKPFFLACGLFRPHLPWYVPQKFYDQYPLDQVVLPETLADDREDLPAAGMKFAAAREKDFELIRNAGRWRHAVRAYLASISCADDRLGRVLSALVDCQLVNNTMIVSWSDHGWHLGEKQHWHKTTLWEEATRVPLIIKVPGLPSGVCRRPVSLIDIFPTINELCRLKKTPQKLDGHSLHRLLINPNINWKRPAIIESGRGNAAIRSERYRYIRYQDGSEELYDHHEDPNEFFNLAQVDQHFDTKKKLATWIPQKWAQPAVTKKGFVFDPQNFTWKHKTSGQITRGR